MINKAQFKIKKAMRNSYIAGHMERCARFPNRRVSVARGQRITINKEIFEE